MTSLLSLELLTHLLSPQIQNVTITPFLLEPKPALQLYVSEREIFLLPLPNLDMQVTFYIFKNTNETQTSWEEPLAELITALPRLQLAIDSFTPKALSSSQTRAFVCKCSAVSLSLVCKLEGLFYSEGKRGVWSRKGSER